MNSIYKFKFELLVNYIKLISGKQSLDERYMELHIYLVIRPG